MLSSLPERLTCRRLAMALRRRLALAVAAVRAIRTFCEFRRRPNQRFGLKWSDIQFHLRDATSVTMFDRHYIGHTAWASRTLSAYMPSRHVDVASSLYFVGIVSAFVDITAVDIRPAQLELKGLRCVPGSLARLPFSDESIESLSCMHVIEHVGLGRYGDAIDYDGDIKAVRELIRVLAPGGHLLLVLPIGGTSRICFNAHRIYRFEQVMAMAAPLELIEFALIPDDGDAEVLVQAASVSLVERQRYGCGCFHFQKRSG